MYKLNNTRGAERSTHNRRADLNLLHRFKEEFTDEGGFVTVVWTLVPPALTYAVEADDPGIIYRRTS